MDFLKEPAFIGCIILFIIIIGLAVWFFRQFSSFQDRLYPLESMLSTYTKETNDIREKAKHIPPLIEAIKNQGTKLNVVSESHFSIIRELKAQRKYIDHLVSSLKDSGVSDIKLPTMKKPKYKSKAKKKKVSFESSSDEESSDEDSDDDISEVRKALERKREKKK